MKKILCGMLFIGACLFGILNAENNPSSTQTTTPPLEDFTLGLAQLDGDSGYLPHLVALEKGYFTQAGCNLILHQKKDGGDNEHKRELNDVCLMGRTTVYALEANTPGLIKAFNINTQDAKAWNDAVLVRRDAGITSLGQLKPKQQIGLFGGGPARVPMMKLLLKKANLNPDDFSLVAPMPDWKIHQVENVISRTALINETVSQFNVVYAREPYISLLLAGGNWQLLIDEPLFAKNILSPWPMTMTVFSTKFLKEKPALAKKIASAYAQAVSFIREHPDQAQTILSKYIEKKYGVKDLKIRMVNYSRVDEINLDIIQKQSDWYFENGITKRKIDAKELIYQDDIKPKN